MTLEDLTGYVSGILVSGNNDIVIGYWSQDRVAGFVGLGEDLTRAQIMDVNDLTAQTYRTVLDMAAREQRDNDLQHDGTVTVDTVYRLDDTLIVTFEGWH